MARRQQNIDYDTSAPSEAFAASGLYPEKSSWASSGASFSASPEVQAFGVPSEVSGSPDVSPSPVLPEVPELPEASVSPGVPVSLFRRPTVEVRIGPVTIGGGIDGGIPRPVAVQSMCDTDTNDIEASVAQIGRLREAGCRIVRLTTQGFREAESMREIARQVRAAWPDVALVADVHFQPSVALALAGVVDKVRINPGNYRPAAPSAPISIVTSVTANVPDTSDYAAHNTEIPVTSATLATRKSATKSPEGNGGAGDSFVALVEKCRATGTAIRIGVNHGSLSNHIVEQYGDTPVGMVASAMEFLRVCRSLDFDRVVVSMKASNPRVMVRAYLELVAAMDSEDMHYPLHLGVTEAGNGVEGRIKSAVGIGSLLVDGLGDTIRVSLTEPPENEIPVALSILQACGLDRSRAEFIACPGCGRTLFDLSPVLDEIKAATQHLAGLKIAVMGCIVNGPGEMADADYGYVGAGARRITLYRGRDIVRRDIPQTEAITALIDLLKADGIWMEQRL